MSTDVVAERIGHEVTAEVPLDQVVERVTAGEVIVLNGCLQALGYFETFQSIIRDVFAACIGPDRTAPLADKVSDEMTT